MENSKSPHKEECKYINLHSLSPSPTYIPCELCGYCSPIGLVGGMKMSKEQMAIHLEKQKLLLEEKFNQRESNDLPFNDSLNCRSQHEESTSFNLNARESSQDDHIFSRKEDSNNEEGDELDGSSNYDEHKGISDDNFKKISELMRINSAKSSSQESKPYEYQEFYHQEEENKDESNGDPEESPQESHNNYKVQFELKSHVENLKRKIRKQEEEKHEKHLESKKAALEHILKKKKTEKINQQRIQFISEPEDPGLNENNGIISPNQNDSLAKYDEDDNPQYNIKKGGRNIETAHFQKSAKFDNFSTLREEEPDEIYEEDFENNEEEENRYHSDDDLDKNMEIIIENNPNKRYQHTFGASEDNFDISEINPLEESESTLLTQNKLNKTDTLDVEDNCESYELKPNVKGNNPTAINSKSLKQNNKIGDGLLTQSRSEQRNENIESSAKKQFKMSFKFENKELESLNKDKPTFTYDGLQDSLALPGSLCASSSLKEFEEIHQQAKTALSKGNFSFGNCFYQDSKLDQLEAQNSDNDTFRLETEEDIGYKMKNDWNKKPYYQEHDSKNVRKQWNKKPAFQQEPDQFDDDNDDENWKQEEDIENLEEEYRNDDYQEEPYSQNDDYDFMNQRSKIPYNPEQFEEDWDNEQNEPEEQEYEDEEFENEDEEAQEEPKRQNIALEFNFENTIDTKK